MQNKEWTEPLQPHQAPNIRIVQLDVLRGLAVLGIYWINIVVFGLPSGSYALPDLLGHSDQANIATWAFSELFIEGAMRGLFSILFGASAMVFLDESRLAGGNLQIVDRYYRRTILLILFGMLHAYFLLWPYDILYAYGLLGLFLFPLRKLTPKLLIIIGCLLLLIGEIDTKSTYFSESNVRTATETSAEIRETAKALQTEADENEHEVMRDTMEMRKETDKEIYLANYSHIFLSLVSDVAEQESTMMYTTYFFDIGGMMLIGMALLKLGIISGKRSRRFYIWLCCLGFLFGLLGRGYNVYTDYHHGFTAMQIANYTHVSYSITRLPLTLGYIGLIGLLCQVNFFDQVTRLLAKVGRLALTNYIMQTIISIFLFYGIGFGKFAEFERYQLVFVCMAVWVFQILFSLAWLKYYKLGPLEWVWRSLIYGARQPLRREPQL